MNWFGGSIVCRVLMPVDKKKNGSELREKWTSVCFTEAACCVIIIVHAHDVIVLREDMSSVSKQCIIITITVKGYKNDIIIVVSLLTFVSTEEFGGA